MNEMSMTTTKPQAGENKCHCGGRCKGECCELECLIQPRFFCGQLLTDQDQVGLIVLRPDGTWGAASLREGFKVAVKHAELDELREPRWAM